MRAWSEIGSSDFHSPLFEELVRCYREPQRQYHTLQHLEECLGHYESVRNLAEFPFEVELALWFHDAIYVVQRTDNELRSATWAKETLCDFSIIADRVHQLVLDTQHSAPPATADGCLLVDIDLAILGAASERFEEYELQIRTEYSWVPEHVFRPKRSEILRSFLLRKNIYNTSHFQSQLEATARTNLQRALMKLERD